MRRVHDRAAARPGAAYHLAVCVLAVTLTVILARPAAADTATADTATATATLTTPLRGSIESPDPRTRTTLEQKGYPWTSAGVGRALASGDQTAELAALVAVSALGLRELLPAVQRHLTGPAPTAIEAAATLIEIGDAAARARGMEALVRALGDASWPDVALNAAAYLARAGDAQGLPVLRRAIGADGEALRLQAVLLLPAFAALDGPALDRAALLETVLFGRDTSALVRRAALRVAAEAAPNARRRALLERVAKGDPDEAIRAAATRLLDAD